MGREIVYCDICGERILETDFEKTSAFTAKNKSYCPKCAEKAPARPPPPPPAAPSPSGKSSGLHAALQQDTPRRLTRPGSSGKTSGLLPSIRSEIPGKKITTRKYDPATGRKSQTGRVPQTDTRTALRPRAGPPPIILIAAGVFAALVLLIIIIVVVSRGSARRRAEAPKPVQAVAVRPAGMRTAG